MEENTLTEANNQPFDGVHPEQSRGAQDHGMLPTPPVTESVAPPMTPVHAQSTSSLLKSPLLWLGMGAVIIIFLGGLFLFSKEKPPSPTTNYQLPITSQAEPTGSIEIQEQQEVDAIRVGTLDDDFEQIDQEVNQL